MRGNSWLGNHVSRLGNQRWIAPTLRWDFDYPTFGVIENGIMTLNDSGKMVQRIWNEMPEYYSGIEMGEFIVMPDHIHGIITINDTIKQKNVGAITLCDCPTAKRDCPAMNC
ncbi:MAG: hypothetical protein LBC85_03110 [Fibromonadaceae bacterium]|jgi:hypothetical protein|nr:hypothetical protein [Fibromonadaceae bacterium]